MGRRKQKTVGEKYIYKTTNHGKIVWVVCTYDVRKKQQRRQFSNLKAAKAYLSTLQDGQRFDIADFARLPIERIEDIRAALAVLPENKSLKDAVLKAYGNDTLASLEDFTSAYNLTIDSRNIKSRHANTVKSHITSLNDELKSFENINETSIFDFLKNKGNARATLEKWFADINDFFKFCIRREAIRFNPLDKFTIDDFGRAKSDKHRVAISVETASNFIHYIDEAYPQFLKYIRIYV